MEARCTFKGPCAWTMALSDTMEQQSVFETARPSHLAVPRTRSRLPRLFGRYLVEAGAIGAKDVAEALALMRLVNSPMGEIAVGEGLLSNVQVQTILDAQRQVDERVYRSQGYPPFLVARDVDTELLGQLNEEFDRVDRVESEAAAK